MKLIATLLTAFLLLAPARAQDAPQPAPQPTWGQEPIEKLSDTRGQIVLNGLWKFQPAIGANAEAPPDDWGLIRVPGSWVGDNKYTPLGGALTLGKSAAWQDLTTQNWDAPWQNVSRAWYERPLQIPASWAGRDISLDFRRVSTDAQVFVNDVDCGRIGWPGGTVGISRAVTPGRAATLRVLVVAAGDKDVETVFMGPAAGQIETRAVKLDTRGLTDDVFLESAPRGARVTDVFVQPSTRKKSVTLDVEVDAAQAGPIEFTARMLDEKGAVEKTFSQTANARPGVQTVRLTFAWPNARLWDLDKPNLYRLMLRARGAGLDDEYPQSFGFREFWIDGRQVMLNGTPFPLRPAFVDGVEIAYNQIQLMDGVIHGLKQTGYNIQEIWPKNPYARGAVSFQDLYLERADEKGWPVIGALGSMAGLAGEGAWDVSGVPTAAQLAWRENVWAQLRRERNHPSCVMWVHSANRFGSWDDQNPRRVGDFSQLVDVPGERDLALKTRVGLEANAFIKSLDPTRGVTTHSGGAVGDINTTNTYLNFIPFQEQEEWLSQWSQTGDRPFMPVEFGFILGCDFKRGRMPGAWGRGQGTTYSEHETTERLAQFWGRQAYQTEPPAARAIHAKQFLGDAKVDLLGKPLSPMWDDQYYRDRPDYVHWDLTYDLMALHYKTMYRSWRTMGTTGGMVPWDAPVGWDRIFKRVPAAPFVPGQRGAYNSSLESYRLYYLTPQGAKTNIVADTLIDVNSATLAWICGAEIKGDVAAFTAKDHSFTAGARVQKRVALLNDSRDIAPYSVNWTATLGRRQIAKGEKNGKLNVGQTLFVPLEFGLPRVTEKADGTIAMTARIGGVEHQDTFAFRAFPALAPARASVLTFDPAGKTTAMLKSLGFQTTAWNGAASNQLLVIGREALSGGGQLPGDLGTFVRGGGRVLMMEQDPDWLRRTYGFRISHWLPRRVFAVDPKHPLMQGLDDGDLHDWAGSSTLVAAKPIITVEDRSPTGYPVHGWRWGNRGAISSAMIEKPHRSSWRPMLEGDFDLAFSPLMEMESGAGRITLCTLDLEDHFGQDAGAAKLAANLLSYARTAPLSPKAKQVFYLGGDAGAAQLRQLGVMFERATQVPSAPGLLIIGSNAKLNLQPTDAFFQSGGRALMLAETKSGAETVAAQDFSGSLAVPDWDECRGLSPSDLRWRAPHDTLLISPTFWKQPFKIGADGLLARAAYGQGELVMSQINPDQFNADEQTYFRFTRWRSTRALSQILANMGATFESDADFFAPDARAANRIALDGDWKVVPTQTLEAATQMDQTTDAGPSAVALSAVAPAYDDARAASVSVPGNYAPFDKSDGEAVFRRVVDVPAAWAGEDLTLSLGPIDDYDNTFWNGEPIGKTDVSTPNAYAAARAYTVPGRLVKAGRNVLAVRVFDRYGGGGFGGARATMGVQPSAFAGAGGLYYPDEITQYALGDAPDRYYRW